MPKRAKVGSFVQKGCKCKRSACRKNYCECFVNKLKCCLLCKCVDCCNRDAEAEPENGGPEVSTPLAYTKSIAATTARPDAAVFLPYIGADLATNDAATFGSVAVSSLGQSLDQLIVSVADSTAPVRKLAKQKPKTIIQPPTATSTSTPTPIPTKTITTTKHRADDLDTTEPAIIRNLQDECGFNLNIISEDDIDNAIQCMFAQAEECETCHIPEECIERRIIDEMERTLVLVTDIVNEYASIYGESN